MRGAEGSGLVRLGEEKDFRRYNRLLYLPAGHQEGRVMPLMEVHGERVRVNSHK